MASPKDFNDPFDCRIPYNFRMILEAGDVNEYCLELTRKHFPHLADTSQEFQQLLQEAIGRFDNVEELQESFTQDDFSKSDKHAGILSLSRRWDSILMWSHYGDYHRGFCVGFDEQMMIDTNLFGSGMSVEYSDEFPNVYPNPNPNYEELLQENMRKNGTKAKDWEYEEEYRFINIYYPEEASTNDRKVMIPDECYREIILGIKFPAEGIDEILSYASSKNIIVYQATQPQQRFQIHREQIYPV